MESVLPGKKIKLQNQTKKNSTFWDLETNFLTHEELLLDFSAYWDNITAAEKVGD